MANVAIYTISIISAIIGGMLVASSSILVKELRPGIDQCQNKEGKGQILGRDEACNPIYGNIGAAVLGIAAGLTQIIICVVVLVNRGRISRHTGLATHVICFAMTLIAFSVSMHFDRSDLVKVLKLFYEGWKARLNFFYASTGIAWIYGLFVVILIKVTKNKSKCNNQNAMGQGQPVTYLQYPQSQGVILNVQGQGMVYNNQPIYPQSIYNTQPVVASEFSQTFNQKS